MIDKSINEKITDHFFALIKNNPLIDDSIIEHLNKCFTEAKPLNKNELLAILTTKKEK